MSQRLILAHFLTTAFLRQQSWLNQTASLSLKDLLHRQSALNAQNLMCSIHLGLRKETQFDALTVL